MKPTFAFNYSADMNTRDAILSTNGIKALAILGQCAYFFYLFFSQFGKITIFSPRGCSVFSFVKIIGRVGIPSKIFKAIIIPYPIIVTGLHSRGTMAYKGLQNKNMNAKAILSIVFPGENGIITTTNNGWLNRMRTNNKIAPGSLSSKGAYIAKITNLIPQKALYIFPDLIFHIKQLVRCLWQMLSGQFAASDYSFYYNATHADCPDSGILH